MSRKKWQSIRYESGEIDDVAISGDTFRMEQMDTGFWWVAIYRGGKETSFNLYSKKPIKVTINNDTIGCEREGETQ
jgi:hypothetical protein